MPKRINYKGWKVWSLQNQWIKLHVVPQLGGRLIQLKMNGYEFFFVNPLLAGKEPDSTRLGENGAWLNFGGEKIWPAPQGWDSSDQWPGPPDPVLDSGEYFMAEISNVKNGIRLTSPFDKYSGLQIRKDVFISENSSEVKVIARFKNEGNVLRTWSIWPVLQMNASGEIADQYQVVCPANPESSFTNGYKVMHGLVNNPQYKIDDNGNVRVDYQYLVGKIGLDTDSNWAAFVDTNSGKVFVLMFQCPKDQLYPEETSLQIWTSGRGMVYSRNTIRQHSDDRVLNPPYMEMELLSPLQKIEPGKEIQFEYRMLASTISLNESIKSANEFGVIANSLKLKQENDGAFVNAKYGVFSEGVLKIQVRGISNVVLPVCLSEMKVSPLNGIDVAFFIDKKFLSDGEVITADLFDRDDHFVGEIDRVNLSCLT